MTQIATYNQARSLKHALAQFGVMVKDETFEMTDSGIYIPRWIGYSRIPHHFDTLTGTAQWYFFFRFVNTSLADINVGEALDFTNSTVLGKTEATKSSMEKLVAHIESNVRKVKK